MIFVGGVASGALALAVLSACNRSWDKAGPRQFQPPTATEVFNLRSKCAELGQKLIAESERRQEKGGQSWDYISGSGSRYDTRSNRCYAWLWGRNNNPLGLRDYIEAGHEAFDAQTGEFLAGTYVRHDDSRSPKDEAVGEVTIRNWETLVASLRVPPNKIPRDPATGQLTDNPKYNHDLAEAIIDRIIEDPRE